MSAQHTMKPGIAQVQRPAGVKRRKERSLPFHQERIFYNSRGAVICDVARAPAFIAYVFDSDVARVEDCLYHYTSRESFSSILKSGSFWASHHSSMNDFTEIEYAFDLLTIRLKSMLRGGGYVDRIKLVKQILLDGCDFYMVSFSRNGNLLSQWRAYASTGGVSFSLPAALFPRLGGGFRPYKLRDVIYDQQEQKRRIDPLAKFLEELILAEISIDKFVERVDEIKNSFREIAPIFKHPGFQEEGEVRLISDGFGYLSKDRFRVDGNCVKYIEISFLSAFSEAVGIDFPIYDIYSAPSLDPDTALRDIHNILLQNKYKFTNIIDSCIPFRGF